MALGYASQYTGQDDKRRREEANKLLDIIDSLNLPDDQFTENELSFLRRMYQDRTQPVSGKEIMFLRDLKDKYL